ncbi:MAG: putative RND superfamily exporter protein [Halieaceae bacterium]|jgi:predicted RND superfamily exporter protein
MNKKSEIDRAESFFRWTVARPKTLLTLSMVLMAAALMFLPQLYKDTRSDAFLAADNPALVYREKVKEQFGLSDPLVIAVVSEGGGGVFTPQTLQLVEWLTDAVMELPNIDAARVKSLATEKNIVGSAEGMDVIPFFDPVPQTLAESATLREAIEDFPLYYGSLVARDGKATLVVAEMVDELAAEGSYQRIMALVAAAPVVEGVEIHVAGEGAIAGYLGSYIDADAQRLNPLAGLIITLIMIYAFRRFSPALFGNVIIAASVFITLGVMAGNGIAFFVITNALPVILIGISVADAIHIYSTYFELQAKEPDRDITDLTVATMVEMWRPITLTSITTAAGFLGLYLAAYMPPFMYFGLFAAFGVMVAWFFSLFFLPAAIVLSKPRVHPRFIDRAEGDSDYFTRAMTSLGRASLKRPRVIIGLFVAIAITGLFAASHLQVDEDRIATFHHSEPIFQADKLINRHLDGSNNIDIVVETPNPEDLFRPENLQRMEALQRYAESLPFVQGSTSIVDYLKQMNRSLDGGAAENYRLPSSAELAAQYFLIYSASSDPTDFEEEVDYDYQTANIRLNLNSGRYQDTHGVVEALQTYIDASFNDAEIHATLSGRVNVNYHWIKDLGQSHFLGLGVALVLVWAVASLLFGSLQAGTLALIPVAGAILLVYSAMVSLGISLGIGTSMFASVAIGLGVDFAIHTLDRLRGLYRELDGDMDRVFDQFYATTGRALLFNFLAIAFGFGVLIFSKVVPLMNFGSIVVVAVTTSFIASLTLLPAVVKVFTPRFIVEPEAPSGYRWGIPVRVGLVVLGVSALTLMALPGVANAVETPALSADAIVARVNQADDGGFVTRKLAMQMVDRRGKVRDRKTVSYRKYFGEEKRTVLFYEAPANIRDTAFMTWDYPDHAVDDDQWLYLPALRKVRRISASDRGDYFLGTDFTYEDIKLEGKLEPEDFDFSLLGEEEINGTVTFKLASVPKTPDIARELGYGRTEFWVDPANWMVVRAEFWDPKDKPLKSLVISDIRQVDGIWTRHQLEVTNHQTGHLSRFTFSEVDYQSEVRDAMFSRRTLSRGR